MIVMALPWWQIFLGFFLMLYICGLVLALIFQVAHVIKETEFYSSDNRGSAENNWAIHQMMTTANFANKSGLFSWLIGGLNFQIEHHLFPNICHVHYRKISSIVKETAKEFNLPYKQHRTFFGALKSHFIFLNQLGTGKYDKMMAHS
jgi:linoleoyl-CoA desaturase